MIQKRLHDKEKEIQGLKKQTSSLLNRAWEKGYVAGFDDGYETGRQAGESLQLKQIIDLVQKYVDKETPEKICDEDLECWGIEATTLLGKIADILKIDRCEEVKDDAVD